MHRSFLALIILLCCAGSAFAISQAQTTTVRPKPAYYCNFYNGWLCGTAISVGRTSSGNYFNANGLLESAPAATPRFDYGTPGSSVPMGVLIENFAATNIVLCSRDLTAATCTGPAWVATNITPATNAIGIDGIMNAATGLTATAGNGTILQTITLASSSRTQSAYIQRVTGTGEIDMTTDGGTTWTAVTCSGGFTNIYGTCDTTSQWVRVKIPVQAAVTNPAVGFRIVTNGDAVIVDGVMNETSNANNPLPTSVIMTTTAAQTRSLESYNLLSGSAMSALIANASTTILEGSIPYSSSGLTEYLLKNNTTPQDTDLNVVSATLRAFPGGNLLTPSSAFNGNTLSRAGVSTNMGLTILGSSQAVAQPTSKASGVRPLQNAPNISLCPSSVCHIGMIAIYPYSVSSQGLAQRVTLGFPLNQ